MPDLALYQDTAGNFDLATNDNDFFIDWSLTSNIIVSLFTDAQADANELRDGETDRRGYWGDTFESNESTGSKLWLLSGKATQAAANDAASHANDALKWLTPDFADSYTAAAAINGGCIELQIEIFNPKKPIQETDLNATAQRYIDQYKKLKIVDRDNNTLISFNW